MNLNQPVTVNMLEAKGGVFNNFDPDLVGLTEWATLILEFSDCDTVSGILDGLEGEQHFDLVKLAGVEGLVCE